ncbi:alpha-L-arabinofuranosidase C-terminal domain-containing protein [Candidatus Halobonum tyrrellensis]|uniref:non-reducing end alpha-L-arabinofuranosidase n=1 Tax=Candidatus Halobonum tyrrellensis G22 TaxID=1324957 RepID=V4HF99_9EURY|nr:alpha-L-arabinofuranosidase C-terminal domain-containing protein [Candidatus Halobonum tyrrellensis]ESP89350.1 alpha-L-arabinofuranosidase domain protein [Candidatus Halobonum tyrrellensis G22]
MTHLLTHAESDAESRATVELDPSREGDPVAPELYGKFGEHLYSSWNVSNVLEAGCLFNPTLAAWKFQEYEYDVDGGRGGVSDPDEIADRVETYADTHGVPGADRLVSAYRDGAALWWFPYAETGGDDDGGDEDRVRTSPDVGTAGDRAQRVEVDGGGDPDGDGARAGLAQWCHLPVGRTRGFEGRVTLRAAAATAPASVRLALHPVDDGEFGDPLATAEVAASEAYETVDFSLDLPAEAADASEEGRPFGFSLTVAADANLVVDRVLLHPDDHHGTTDPEVADTLAEMDLSVLRWPGGNFASGYHWRDGVGPVEARPTKPNPAWDAVETNLFGTDEFVRFCERVGCEPMICVNGGDGTAAEAARWVEYCNGSTDTEMGALRAEHGHPEPYGVDYWEIGNELYGEWQKTWTTPDGYADRFRRYEAAMEAVDPDIEVFACGNRLTDWNQPLVETLDDGDWLTDHVLVECHADVDTDPVELFNAHSGFARKLGEQYREVAADLAAAGVPGVRQAITELQLFTRFDEAEEGDADGADDGSDADATDRDGTADPPLERETLPTNESITEAVFDATVVHECIRTEGVEMVTHSGVGNHGGGLRKSRGKVWVDPCYYGQQLGAGLAGGTPVGVDLACPTFSTDTRFGSETNDLFGELDPVTDAPAVDAMAVVDAAAGDLAVMLVHCDAGADAIEVTVEAGDLLADVDCVTVDRLAADTMYERNTFEEPERVTPTTNRAVVDDEGRLTVSLPPYSLVRVTADCPE